MVFAGLVVVAARAGARFAVFFAGLAVFFTALALFPALPRAAGVALGLAALRAFFGPRFERGWAAFLALRFAAFLALPPRFALLLAITYPFAAKLPRCNYLP
jgi:hypothetical protein